ncbi:S-adenosyl-L-methionine-dependent methyltransferase [Dacryopinax primogenitus]|uniref:S-adenosyl-L-methionine-dependent methyltransferase n=1 Tax=Dacryopinax primogenitus (strain DJM 731) TaxID=1858805 RepID=M5G391_DACPD|nr:S-adenosyl-L-methionine-dependent methyltransferase [Dacryopinax primogenitus]EJU02680.1 S-adenosyl-L-methionine-dependent methyltransferase [Dacryopinax primogenitus]
MASQHDANDDDALPPELITTFNELKSSLLSHSLPSTLTALKAGAPAWYQDPESGWGALHYAAEWGDEAAVKAVLDAGGVWNALDNLGNTAADIAISRNEQGVYELIRDAGLRSELLLHLLAQHSALTVADPTPAANIDSFLSSHLVFHTDGDGQEVCSVYVPSSEEGEEKQVEVGVMMAWERVIMQETVDLLSSSLLGGGKDLRVLNVGFGLGIIDTLFQSLSPVKHTIIEPHPDVLAHMEKTGWANKPGVEIRRGKWQDVLLQGEGEGEKWDIVYFDTFSEHYSDLRQFFALLPKILSGPRARFSFFNGLGATNAVFYDVASRLAEIHLLKLGLSTHWVQVWVKADVLEAWYDSRQYFKLEWYKLPICSLRAA